MPSFSGTLNSNVIFAAIWNMIISQQVFADNLMKHQNLIDEARVDGSLFGDTKLYYATDVLKSYEWTNDSEAANLLALNRPAAPSIQAITINQFRQVFVTVDEYLTKQAFKEPGAFSQFTAVTLSWLRDTKRVHDGTTFNTFIGTDESSTGDQSGTIPVSTAISGLSGDEANRVEAMTIAQHLADLLVKMGDYSRDYNDYQYMRSTSEDKIKIVWNSAFINKIRKVDLPTIFHKESVFNDISQRIMPSRYFGVAITSSNISSYSASTPAPGKPINSGTNAYTPGTNHANGCIRSLVEKTYTSGGVTANYFPGDELPNGATIVASTGDWLPGECYIEDPTIIFKIYVELPPFMSAMDVGTSFFNPRSLTTNHYVTWGHNTLEHLKNYPCVVRRRG